MWQSERCSVFVCVRERERECVNIKIKVCMCVCVRVRVCVWPLIHYVYHSVSVYKYQLECMRACMHNECTLLLHIPGCMYVCMYASMLCMYAWVYECAYVCMCLCVLLCSEALWTLPACILQRGHWSWPLRLGVIWLCNGQEMSTYVCILLRFAHFYVAHTRANLAGSRIWVDVRVFWVFFVYQKLGVEYYYEDLYANQRGDLIGL